MKFGVPATPDASPTPNPTSANIYNPTPEELEAAKKDKLKWESAVADEVMEGQKSGDRERSKGLADRGKEWLFGRK
jgi:hypothetical protein